MKRLINIGILIISLTIISCSSKHEEGFNPLLVLATNSNFGTYTGEILKAEGFNEFKIDSLNDSNVTLNYLQHFDLVILTESEISPKSKDMMSSYVNDGGNLIAFRPDKEMSNIFGLKNTNEVINDEYIQIDISTDIGTGLLDKSMQFHGEADIYNLDGAKEIASFVNGENKNSEYPAVIYNNFGKGHALAFLYSLPKNIVYTRQGNPKLAGQEKDGITGIRAMDMFTDGWLDANKTTINQADEQMRLLTHSIEKMDTFSNPLPRLWYFPDTLKCLVTLTNDGENSNQSEFESQFEDIDSAGAKMSLYILQTGKVSKEWTDKWENKGFEISGHTNDTKEATSPTWQGMDKAIQAKMGEISNKYGLTMITTVNHWFVWDGIDSTGQRDFAAQAELEAKHGLEMDVNYARYDMNSSQGHFLGPMGKNQGNFTGSGLVMKFANKDGKIIDVYQHLNDVYDQQYMESKDPEGFFNAFKGLMDRSLNDEVYSYISIKAHNNEYFFSKSPLLKMIEYAHKKNIPVWTVRKLLKFIKMRDEAKFTEIKWDDSQLSFNLESSLEHKNGLTCMIPYIYKGENISAVSVDGEKKSYIIRSIKGFKYALVTVVPGSTYDFEIKYKD